LTLLAIELETIMASFVSIFTAAIIFLSSSAWCNLGDGWKAEQGLNGGADPQHERFARRHPAVFVRENIYEPHYSAADKSKRGTSFLEGRSLDGPALLASWLGIRQLTCPEQNYFVCASALLSSMPLITQLTLYR
jgi:hypothetical protein